MKSILTAAALAVAASSSVAQTASDYPNKPIKILTTQAPGTASDLLARLLAEKMGASLKTPIIVENKPGAGGIIALDTVAKAKPDGYTIGLGGASTHVILPAIRTKMPYDSLKDFEYMGQIATSPGVIVATKDFPANNIKELVELAKKNTDLQYASWGNGSTGNFCGELLNQWAGIHMQHIAYKSVANIQTDLFGGHIKLAQIDGGSAPAMVRSGKVKAIGSCTSKSVAFPKVSSYEDEGIINASSQIGHFRFGLYAPAGTPAAVAQKLELAMKATIDLPEVKAKLLEMGLEPSYLPGTKVKAMTVNEIAYWRNVAKTSSIHLD